MEAREFEFTDSADVRVVQARLDPRLMYALANGRLYIPQGCTFAQLEAIVAAFRERLNATRKDDEIDIASPQG